MLFPPKCCDFVDLLNLFIMVSHGIRENGIEHCSIPKWQNLLRRKLVLFVEAHVIYIIISFFLQTFKPKLNKLSALCLKKKKTQEINSLQRGFVGFTCSLKPINQLHYLSVWNGSIFYLFAVHGKN